MSDKCPDSRDQRRDDYCRAIKELEGVSGSGSEAEQDEGYERVCVLAIKRPCSLVWNEGGNTRLLGP